MNLQSRYDLEVEKDKLGRRLIDEVHPIAQQVRDGSEILPSSSVRKVLRRRSIFSGITVRPNPTR